MLRYAVFIAPRTKNLLHQRRQMLNFFTPSYSALLKIIAYSWVSKPNIIFLIHTRALSHSLFLTRIFAFHLSLCWFSLNPRLISHHATLFFFLVLPQPKLFSSLYGRTQKPKLESAFKSGWVSVLEASFLSWRDRCSWLGLRPERLGLWSDGHRRG